MLVGLQWWRSRTPTLDRLSRDIALTWTDPRIILVKETRVKGTYSWLWPVHNSAYIYRIYEVRSGENALELLEDYRDFLKSEGVEVPEKIRPAVVAPGWHLVVPSSEVRPTLIEVTSRSAKRESQ